MNQNISPRLFTKLNSIIQKGGFAGALDQRNVGERMMNLFVKDGFGGSGAWGKACFQM